MVDNTRVYSQYKSKPKAVGWYNIVPTMANQLTEVYNGIRGSYDIDNATSHELDVIGNIVVIDRSYESELITSDGPQFGADTSQFGGDNMQFGSDGVVVSDQVSNDIFRVIIRSKIAKNNSNVTLDSIVEVVNYVAGVDSGTSVLDGENMTFSVQFEKELDSITRFVFNNFDIVPTPQGVEMIGFVELPLVTQFGSENAQFNDDISQFGMDFGA